jgi:hypothetical protein
MSETPRAAPLVPDPTRATSIARQAAPAAPKSASPAFEALLERLTARASDLEERSRTLQAPEEVPAALDAARASLEDALTLSERLLEAYRRSQLPGGGEGA